MTVAYGPRVGHMLDAILPDPLDPDDAERLGFNRREVVSRLRKRGLPTKRGIIRAVMSAARARHRIVGRA